MLKGTKSKDLEVVTKQVSIIGECKHDKKGLKWNKYEFCEENIGEKEHFK